MPEFIRSFRLIVAALSIAGSLQAKTLQYPENDPAFSMNLPDDWTVERWTAEHPGPVAGFWAISAESSALMEFEPKSAFSFGIMAAPTEINSEEKLRAYLLQTLPRFADDPKIGEFRDMRTAKSVNLRVAQVRTPKLKDENVEFVASVTTFTFEKKPYFIILAVNIAPDDAKYRKAMDEIISSIAPVAASKPD